jgi:hypothetical protein
MGGTWLGLARGEHQGVLPFPVSLIHTEPIPRTLLPIVGRRAGAVGHLKACNGVQMAFKWRSNGVQMGSNGVQMGLDGVQMGSNGVTTALKWR